MSKKKLDAQAFNNPETEQAAIEDHAIAISALMESLVIVNMTFDNEGFPESLRRDFEKALKRASNTILSVVPNQYKQQVFGLIRQTQEEALAESQEAGAQHAEPASTPST
jgi:hypothetical protein